MSGDNLVNIKKVELTTPSSLISLDNCVNNNFQGEDSQESVFCEANIASQNDEVNKDNLVEIEDLEKTEEEKQGFFKTLWKKLFSSKKIKDEENTTNSKEISQTLPTVSPDELQKIEDYKKLSQEDPKYTVNGEIDQDFRQGNAADCVLLAGMYSLSKSEAGRAIIKDAIAINYDENWNTESYDVYFKGLDKTYNIPVEEYKEAERLRLQYQRGEADLYYSAGDDDMLLMELAYKAAFDDINEAKRSSSMFAKTDALKSIDYEQFLYAFAGTEDVNPEVFVINKYRDMQIEENSPKIREIFETQKEFKFEDVYMSDKKISSMTVNSFVFNWEDTYIVEKKPSESENNEITIRNKKTGETLTMDSEFLIESFAGNLTSEQIKQTGLDMYNLAVESDFVFFANASKEPVNVIDTDGNTHKIYQQHAYGVKEITEEYLILINPHNSEKEIKISRDEYLKYYKEIEGFELFFANFEE